MQFARLKGLWWEFNSVFYNSVRECREVSEFTHFIYFFKIKTCRVLYTNANVFTGLASGN